MSNRASPSPATLKSSCASADNISLIDRTVELVTKVRCDDRTHEDLISMLTEPTRCGLWITWRGLQCEAGIGLAHPDETMSGINPGYSCKEGTRQTPTRIPL
jgi:hypothetical protein